MLKIIICSLGYSCHYFNRYTKDTASQRSATVQKNDLYNYFFTAGPLYW